MSGPLVFETVDQWMTWREGKIGGSLIGAVLGLDDAWDTPLDAYYRLIGMGAPVDVNEQMLFGTHAQGRIAAEWARRNGATLIADQPCYDHPDEARLSVTLDYVTDKGLVEVKTSDALHRWRKDGELAPPAYIEAQARWQLGLVRANGGRDTTCRVVLMQTTPSNLMWFALGEDRQLKLDEWPIDHDEAIWADMRDAALGFLHNHVDRRRPPKAVLADLERLAVDAGTDTTPLIATGQQAVDINAAALDYFDRAARARETQKDADEAKAVLYQLIGSATDVWAGDTDSKPLVHVGRQNRTSVALKGIDPWLLDTLERRGHINRTEFPTLKVNVP